MKRGGGYFETSIARNIGILVSLIKRKMGKGSYKSGIFFGRTFMRTFLAIRLSLVIKK